jgi:hypothetical protein
VVVVDQGLKGFVASSSIAMAGAPTQSAPPSADRKPETVFEAFGHYPDSA